MKQETWLADRRRRVDEGLVRFVAEAAVAPPQAELLERMLVCARVRRDPPGVPVLSVHLPLAVHRKLTGEDEPALPVAEACALLELGIDLLDHVQDRELAPALRDVPLPLILLAANGFLGSLPQLRIARSELPDATKAALLSSIAESLPRFGYGQQLDLSVGRQARPDPAATLEVARWHAERRALYAVLGAQLAGASDTRAVAAAAQAWGVAQKLASDLHDLDAAEGSRDLRSGTRTFPIAWALTQRPALLELLEHARTDDDARAEAARAVLDTGAARRTMMEIELHRVRAAQSFVLEDFDFWG